MVRAVSPSLLPCSISGHRTRSAFDRYDIVTLRADRENNTDKTRTMPATASHPWS